MCFVFNAPSFRSYSLKLDLGKTNMLVELFPRYSDVGIAIPGCV